MQWCTLLRRTWTITPISQWSGIVRKSTLQSQRTGEQTQHGSRWLTAEGEWEVPHTRVCVGFVFSLPQVYDFREPPMSHSMFIYNLGGAFHSLPLPYSMGDETEDWSENPNPIAQELARKEARDSKWPLSLPWEFCRYLQEDADFSENVQGRFLTCDTKRASRAKRELESLWCNENFRFSHAGSPPFVHPISGT
jgi:hypothetical protein